MPRPSHQQLGLGGRNSSLAGGGNPSSIHSQMIKNKHTFSNPTLASLQQARHGGPGRPSPKGSNLPVLAKHSLLPPKTSIRKPYLVKREERKRRSPEERKRSHSASNESVISTASSNSPNHPKNK